MYKKQVHPDAVKFRLTQQFVAVHNLTPQYTDCETQNPESWVKSFDIGTGFQKVKAYCKQQVSIAGIDLFMIFQVDDPLPFFVRLNPEANTDGTVPDLYWLTNELDGQGFKSLESAQTYINVKTWNLAEKYVGYWAPLAYAKPLTLVKPTQQGDLTGVTVNQGISA